MSEKARCQGSGPDDQMLLDIIEKHRDHNEQSSTAHQTTGFTNQMEGALQRQDILLDALHSHTG